jgi:hypothetical protein
LSVLETVWEEEGKTNVHLTTRLGGEPGRESLLASAVEIHPGETIAPSARERQSGKESDEVRFGLPLSDPTQCKESLGASPESRHSELSPTGPRGVGEIEPEEDPLEPARLMLVGSLAHLPGGGEPHTDD